MKSEGLCAVADFEVESSKMDDTDTIYRAYRIVEGIGSQDNQHQIKPLNKKRVPTLEELGYSFEMGM